MGWRLVIALSALALVVVGASLVLLAVAPEPNGSGLTANSNPSVLPPWAACARAVRDQLAEPHGVEVRGPTLIRWETSGVGVDLSGHATGAGIRPTAFGCHAIRLGTTWQVERVILAGP